jgi:serine/threonine-protein kinase
MGLEIGKTVDGYEIVEVLGSSKTGVAYKVRNVFAQRFEVLKILPKSVRDDEEQNARFLREIKVHAQLLHPNIVTFYNAREMEGQLVMTTEFVPGATLAERLEAGPIAWCDACQYAGQVLSALGYAHAHGIVHRGLSSSNLILTPEGIIRLTGFGLAKSTADPDLTAAGSVIGALKYMAPEQVKGEHIDGRSDLYSLGIVLYEMLTGKLPFAAKGQFEIMLAHVNTAPKHASDINADVPRELGDVVAKALAKSPDDRFSNAQEFRSAIEHVSLPAETKPEAHAPGAEALLNLAPTASEVPWHAEAPSATNGHVKHELPETPIIESHPAPDYLETVQSVEPPGSNGTPTPVSTSEPWDAWTFDTLPVAVESKSKPAEPEPPLELDTPPVSEASTFVDVPHTPLVEPEPEFAESKPAAEPAEVLETPTPVSASPLWSAEAIEAALLSARSKLAPAEPPSAELAPVESPAPAASETAVPLIENAESAEPEAPVSSSFLLDSWAINPNPAPVESTPVPAEVQPEEPAVEAAAQDDTPAPVSSGTLWDTWAVESALASAESELTPAELPPAPHELETVAPLVVQPATLHDPWAIESKAPFAEPEPAQADIETPLPVPVVTAVADTPAPVPAPSLHDAWVSESATPPESQPASPELHLLSAALETPAEPPALDWPATLPDFWVHEPVQPAAESPRESTELKLLSAALEPPQAPPALPSTPEEPPAVESKAPAVELAASSHEPEPVPLVAAAPAVGSAPDPVVVVKTLRPPDPDLLTALFGDTLLSRVSLILVVCAITFFLGTVTLFAVFSVTKP